MIIRKVAALLNQHVTFRNDDTAATFYDSPKGPHHVEMKNLRIKTIVAAPLQATAKADGITKRVQALLAYDMARLLNTETNSWSAWGARSHPFFPLAITFDWRNGHVMPNAGPYLKTFRKGPLQTQATASGAPSNKSATGGSGSGAPTQGTLTRPSGEGSLPPGMKKIR